MTNEFDFGSLEIIETSVVGPNGKKYILREANEESVARFTNARTRCMTLQDGGVTAVAGMGDLSLLLVSLCLFEVGEDGEANLKKNVSVEVLKSWPGRVIRPLFDEAKRISEIDQDDDVESLEKQYKELGERIAKIREDMAKNEPESWEIGSS